jgi:hypothetical protein
MAATPLLAAPRATLPPHYAAFMSAFVDGMAIAGGAAAVLTTAGAIAAGVRARWRGTVSSRRALRKALNGLAAGMPAERLATLLGPCTIRRKVRDLNVLPYFPDEMPELRQLIYMTKHACVDAYVEPDLDTVVAFTITATDPRFTLDIGRLTFGSVDRVHLGRSTFASAPVSHDRNDGVFWWNGARDSGYAEAHYGANPGGYQHYVLAHLQTGTGQIAYGQVLPEHLYGFRSGRYAVERVVTTSAKDDLSDSEIRDLVNTGEVFDPDAWKWFRAGTKINTLQVLGPEWRWTLTRPGVHGDVTRLLRDPPRSTLDRVRAWRRSRRASRPVRQSKVSRFVSR